MTDCTRRYQSHDSPSYAHRNGRRVNPLFLRDKPSIQIALQPFVLYTVRLRRSALFELPGRDAVASRLAATGATIIENFRQRRTESQQMNNQSNYDDRQQGDYYQDRGNRSGQRRQFRDNRDNQYGEGGNYGSRSPDMNDRPDPFYGDQADNRSQRYRGGEGDDAMSGRAYGQGNSGSRGYGSQVNTGPRQEGHDRSYSSGTGYRGDGYRENSRYNRDYDSDRYDDDRYGRDRYEGRNRRDDDDRGFFDKAGDKMSSWFSDDDDDRRRNRGSRGHGPANYSRSNERLLEDACEHLTHDPRIDARQINVTAKDNEITLDGKVTSRREKRAAEDCVHDISGVKHVQNNLRIEDRDDNDRGSGSRREYGKFAESDDVRKDDDATNKATARKKS